MTFLDTLIFRSKELEKEIGKWQQKVNEAPVGHLISRKAGNGKYTYSISHETDNTDKRERFLAKSDLNLAEQLALKEYAAKRILDARSEKYALDKYIATMNKEKQADRYLQIHPGAAELIIPQLRFRHDFIEAWMSADYRQSSLNTDGLKYTTVVPDLLVRSKAEADIISRLVHFGIPLRYEEELIINGIVIHPDISCLNVRTLDKIYWEHQGLWDKPDYVSSLGSREKLYSQVNIVPFKNLIITTETKDQPLDITWVDYLIKYFLL